VFERDGRELLIGQLHECLWRALNAAGLREIRWHDLQHTFASNLVRAGVPLLQVQKWMRHSTINMTMRYPWIPRRKLVTPSGIEPGFRGFAMIKRDADLGTYIPVITW
jgi:integrase